MTKELQSILEEVQDTDAQVLVLSLHSKHTHFNTFSSGQLHLDIKSILEDYSTLLNKSMNPVEIKTLGTFMFATLVHTLHLLNGMGYAEKAYGILTAMIDINLIKKYYG